MNVAPFPAGWYRDPSARHEQRYWDGVRWGPQVLDHGVVAQDPSGAAPDAISAMWVESGPGYRAFRVDAWRLAVLSAASIFIVLTLMYEIFSWILVFGTTFTTDEDWLFMTAWLFGSPTNYSSITYVGFPPPAIYVALFVALVFTAGVSIRQESALKKAGARGSRAWSPAPEKEAWLVATARLRGQTGGRRFNTILRPHHRVFLVLELLTAASIVFISSMAIWQHTAIGIAGRSVPVALSPGLGPWLCLAAGVTLAVATLLAWPIARHQILIRPDGRVEPLS